MIICFAKGSPEIRFNLDRAIAYRVDELESLNIKFFESIINIDFKEEEDLKEAIEYIAVEVLKLSPDFSIDRFLKHFPYKDKKILEGIGNALRKAGLPN